MFTRLTCHSTRERAVGRVHPLIFVLVGTFTAVLPVPPGRQRRPRSLMSVEPTSGGKEQQGEVAVLVGHFPDSKFGDRIPDAAPRIARREEKKEFVGHKRPPSNRAPARGGGLRMRCALTGPSVRRVSWR